MKTPRFWQRKSFVSILLIPFSAIYYSIFLIKNLLIKPIKLNKKIICIGNLTAGGSGKTPTAIALGKIMQDMSIDFNYLSRGYNGSNKKLITLYKNQQYNPDLTGDEPLLLKEIAPTIICKNRLKAAKQIARNKNLKAIILDDGMQNKSLAKDFTILVIDTKIKFGNNMIFPAGPLRQTINSGINQADLIVVIGDKLDQTLDYLPDSKTTYAKINITNLNRFKDKKLLAFCGLAYPQKFFDLLHKNKLNIVKKIEFEDHFKYKQKDLEKILDFCQKNSLTPITTKKDWVKFSKKYQDKINYLDIELVFNNDQIVRKKIDKMMNSN